MPTSPNRRAALVLAAGLLAVQAAVADAQSLGDVARRATRSSEPASQSGRVYTNEDLAAVQPPAPQPLLTPTPAAGDAAQAAPLPATPAAPVPPTVMVEDPSTHKVDIRTTAPPRQKRDEQYWRSRAADLRQKLARARADLAAAQSNLDSLQRSQQPAAVRERQVVGGLVERLQVEVRQHEGDIAKLETQAASSGVPPTWVR